MSAAAAFFKSLGASVADRFDGEARFLKTKRWIEWSSLEGTNYVGFIESSKWSPIVSFAITFGCRFNAAARIERLIGDTRGGRHISQNSYNVGSMEELPIDCRASWRVNIHDPQERIVEDIVEAIRQIAFPFWARYPTARAARDAILSNDSWCICGAEQNWPNLITLDAAIGESHTSESWIRRIAPFYAQQANERLCLVKEALRMQSNNSLDGARGGQ